MKISVVIPVHNEEGNIPILGESLARLARGSLDHWEVLFINDGSTDGSAEAVQQLQSDYGTPNLKFIEIAVPVRGGQSAAILKGFGVVAGDVVVTMDGDLQNDPSDIPNLLSHVGNYDVVAGYRTNRKDGLARLIVSKIANHLRRLLTSDTIKDAGCTLRAYRKECLPCIISGSMGMNNTAMFYFPLFARLNGFEVRQIPVSHNARLDGRSKYRLLGGRTLQGVRGWLALVQKS